MTRVLATLEVDGDVVTGDRVVLRDERGGELVSLPVRSGTDPADVASDLITYLVHEMKSLGAEQDDE